jgi:hypothetical protein
MLRLQQHEQRLRSLITDTLTMLCKNSVLYKEQLSIDALIGITFDKENVFLLNIKEIVNCNNSNSPDPVLTSSSTTAKRKRRHLKQHEESNSELDQDSHQQSDGDTNSAIVEISGIKQEYENDLVDIKSEPTSPNCSDPEPTVRLQTGEICFPDMHSNTLTPKSHTQLKVRFNY